MIDPPTGSYTASSGLPHVRRSVAQFVTRRDVGVPARAKDIFISAGLERALMVIYFFFIKVSPKLIVQMHSEIVLWANKDYFEPNVRVLVTWFSPITLFK